MDFFIGWIVFSILVGVYADTKGRSGVGFILLSLILSPLFGFIIALIVSPIKSNVVVRRELKECKYCEELIEKDDLFCKYCGKEQTQKAQSIKSDELKERLYH